MRRLLWSRSRRSLKPPYPSMASIERGHAHARTPLPAWHEAMHPTDASELTPARGGRYA
jgi:hypothetical protein